MDTIIKYNIINSTMTRPIRQLSMDLFPELLKEIPNPPKQLFLRGDLPSKDTKLLCVIGSRKHSEYGQAVCEKIICGLKGHNISIVSGLALGIDAIAHRSALSAGLHTVAVPGSGLDDRVLYPKTNQPLAHMIMESGGALLSEFDPEFRAMPRSFVERNRIMAGMSHATLVIEAANKSGTLMTSRLALDYNRDILTIPGSIFNDTSYGPHMLIRLGATPVTNSDDVLEALNLQSGQNELPIVTKDEAKILWLLRDPLEKNSLINKMDMSIRDAETLIRTMSIKGLIDESLGKIHKKNI